MILHKAAYYSGATVSFAGLFLAFSSHVFHDRVGLIIDHPMHTYWGMGLALVGLCVMLYFRKNA
ncbi:hypothetical protein HY493_04325 [Candidatus Woesearchaeota archaeon]|nr:hypothetical protein [Candidatus Woesearchaeota archaeon]